MAKTIVGSFDSFEEAQEVFRDLQQSGYSRDDISIIANNAAGRLESRTGDLPADAPATVSDTAAVRRPAPRRAVCSAARQVWWSA